ncbi:hypothetical protein F2Q65_13300 [Thiohalocapsa marina]|uniref:Crp/Fnr family transcriptional regulator n=1 Tax=Thiohalocapsa marina TaxID=424902 RepID=A0A5M8FRT7_9GAMM|nr:hypothetical protein [Thiohalocapsa marina]KAA6184162.1 hypothetical protein F2Q65_13300 [Thiohalocapsa marina]
MLPDIRSNAERRLGKLFRALDGPNRETLLAFAEFLAQRASASSPVEVQPTTPRPESRPAEETVIAAIKRLRRTYPMLDGGTMLSETSTLMAAHVLHGRDAQAVIDELEQLFASRFDAHDSGNGAPDDPSGT